MAIKEMDEKLEENMIKTFELNEKETKTAEKWQENHKQKCKKRTMDSFTGLKYITVSYEFFPTGIGDKVLIKCNCCNKQKDITDYNCW